MLAVPRAGNEKRAVPFTKYGLGIVNSQGAVFFPTGRGAENATATIPKEHFLVH
jgi:hypothetical protein